MEWHSAVDNGMSATLQFKIQRAVTGRPQFLLLEQRDGMGIANGRVPFKKGHGSYSVDSLFSAALASSVNSWFGVVASVGELAPSSLSVDA